MRKMKFLLAFALVFSIALSACSGGGNQQDNANQGAYPGLTGTETVLGNDNTGLGNTNTGLGNDNTGLGNSNANSNANANGNANLNGNTNTSGGDLGTGTPATTGGLGTPAGTALGSASGTPMATPGGTGEGAAVTQTPLGGMTGTELPGGAEGMAYTNGVLLSQLLGSTVSLDSGTASGVGSTDNANANANGNTNTSGTGNTNTGGTTLATATPAVSGNTNTGGTNANGNANANSNGNTNTGMTGNTNTGLGMQGGQTIGVVDSVVVSQADCKILYLLVSSEADGRLIPVPLSAFFARGQTGTLSQPLTISSAFTGLWVGAPGWDVSAMPDMTASDWDTTYSSYWTGAGTGAGDTNANGNGNGNTNTSGGTTLATATPAAGGNTNTGATGNTNANSNANANANANGNTNTTGGAMQVGAGAVRITDITNINATGANGDDLGDINDAVIDLSSQKIAYVILGSGGILGIGEDQIPVPCELVTWQTDGSNVMVVLNVDQTMLENAPTVSAIPSDFSTGYDTEWSTYWDATP